MERTPRTYLLGIGASINKDTASRGSGIDGSLDGLAGSDAHICGKGGGCECESGKESCDGGGRHHDELAELWTFT